MSDRRLEPGAPLGDYRIGSTEPRGRFGTATDQRTDRRVLLQVLPRASTLTATEAESVAEQLSSRSRLHHPQLADLLTFDLDAPVPFVALAHREGQLLDQWLERQPSRFVGASESALASILLGLADAAGASIRLTGAAPDVTADNILFQTDGEAILLAAGQSWPTRARADGDAPSPAELRSLQQIGALIRELLTVSRCDSVELRQMAAACLAARTERSPIRLNQVIRSLRRLTKARLPEGLGDELDPTLGDPDDSARLHALALGFAALLTLLLLGVLGYVLVQTN
ncbi:MAG: hypothetical protein AAGA81_07395 [Acidobacteriota bacterium]